MICLQLFIDINLTLSHLDFSHRVTRSLSNILIISLSVTVRCNRPEKILENMPNICVTYVCITSYHEHKNFQELNIIQKYCRLYDVLNWCFQNITSSDSYRTNVLFRYILSLNYSLTSYLFVSLKVFLKIRTEFR